MPLLSAFTPCGMLALSSQPSEAETIYRALINSLGGNYRTDPGSRMDAWCYATAKRLAVARILLRHAGHQQSPPYVREMMADREAEWQIVPGPNDTLGQRRRVLAARELLPQGATRGALVATLSMLLAADFLALRRVAPSEIVNWPTLLGDQPMNLQLPTVERKALTLTAGVSIGLGAPQTVAYALRDSAQPALLNGDSLVVEPECYGRTETVVVSGVSPTTFVATFSNAHDVGCVGSTAPYPMWTGTQRTLLVLLSAAGGIDPELRRKTHELLARQVREPTTWALVQATDTMTAGPFTLSLSPLNATPFGTITFT